MWGLFKESIYVIPEITWWPLQPNLTWQVTKTSRAPSLRGPFWVKSPDVLSSQSFRPACLCPEGQTLHWAAVTPTWRKQEESEAREMAGAVWEWGTPPCPPEAGATCLTPAAPVAGLSDCTCVCHTHTHCVEPEGPLLNTATSGKFKSSVSSLYFFHPGWLAELLTWSS